MLNRLCSAAEFDPRRRLLGSIFTERARGEGDWRKDFMHKAHLKFCQLINGVGSCMFICASKYNHPLLN